MFLTLERTGSAQWYKAYQLIFEIAILRGCDPENHVQVPTERAFNDTIWPLLQNPQEHGDRYIVFVGQNLRLYFGFYVRDKLAKADTIAMNAFIAEEVMKFNPPDEQLRNPDRLAVQIDAVVIILGTTAYDAKHNLEDLAPNAIPRSRKDPRIAKYSIQNFILHNEFQASPLKSLLQSEMRMITSDAEKERLRLRLIRDDVDKGKQLLDLLPKIPMDDPVAKWYGAQVGDVFYYLRTIGGQNPYYRVVTPPANTG